MAELAKKGLSLYRIIEYYTKKSASSTDLESAMTMTEQIDRNRQSPQGFTLLEIALALAILSVVAIYTLNMYQGLSSQKKLIDDKSRMEEIATALKAYYGGHEGLPAAGTTFVDSIPVADLGLGQGYRFDTHGRPYLYFPAATASGLQVDGKTVAGVIISLGENQLQDYVVAGTTYTTNGDDTLVPVEVNAEAVAIALAELETLGKRVQAYNRIFAGVQDDPGTNFYGDVAAGAPPIIDPDYYDKYYPGVDPSAPAHPGLYPFTPYYLANSGNPDFIQPSIYWPTTFPPGPPPTFTQLVQQEPVNWPGAGAYDGIILNVWDSALAPTSANLWRWPPQGREPTPANDYTPYDGNRPLPPAYAAGPDDDFFGIYPTPPYYLGTNLTALPSYELIDEGGCVLVGGVVPADPNCAFVALDTNPNPVQFIVTQYGLGASLVTDPWGNPYQWGRGQAYANTDRQYHLFFSAGPDGVSGTADDVLLF